MRVRLLVLGGLGFVLALVAAPAWAHVGTPAPADAPPTFATFGPETLSAATPETSAWLLLAFVAMATALLLRHRSAAAITLAVLLAFVAFETGRHSVHHLADTPDGAKCVIAAASSHVGGVSTQPVAFERPAADIAFAVQSVAVAFAPTRSTAPDLGRAPPAA
jgi:hypothetical protein